MYASGYLLVRFYKTSMLLKRFIHFFTYTNRTNRINKKFSQPQVTSENVHKNTMLFGVVCLTIHATQIHTDNLLLRPVTPKMITFPGSRYDNNKNLKI